MRRSSQPIPTDSGEAAVAAYRGYLHDEQDVSAGTRRSYLSELRQFAAWCEASWGDGHDAPVAFAPPKRSSADPSYRVRDDLFQWHRSPRQPRRG